MITRVLLGAVTRRRNILLCFHLACLLQLPSFLTTASISSCPKHRESECVSLFVLEFSLFFFLIVGEPVSFFTNHTCVVHRESRQEIEVTNAKERKSESLEIFLHVICREIYTMYKIIYLNKLPEFT